MYQNTDRTRSHSEFVKVSPFDGTLLTIDAKTSNPTIVGRPVPMVNGTVRVVTPAPVTSCDPNMCDGSVNEALSINFNVKQGSVDSIKSLRDEAIRCLNIALANYSLAIGVVPPSDAGFPVTP